MARTVTNRSGIIRLALCAAAVLCAAGALWGQSARDAIIELAAKTAPSKSGRSGRAAKPKAEPKPAEAENANPSGAEPAPEEDAKVVAVKPGEFRSKADFVAAAKDTLAACRRMLPFVPQARQQDLAAGVAALEARAAKLAADRGIFDAACHLRETLFNLVATGDLVRLVAAVATPAPVRPDFAAERRVELAELADQIRDARSVEAIAAEAYRPEALVTAADSDPAAVVLRRTAAMLKRIGGNLSAAKAAPLHARLSQLLARGKSAGPAARQVLFDDACLLRRDVMAANPAMDFAALLVVKRHRSRYNHMCDQFFGANAIPGGGLFLLTEPFGAQPVLLDLLEHSYVQGGRLAGCKLAGGAFLSPDLSWDGRQIVFAWTEANVAAGRWSPQACWHVFKVNADGSGLVQLTDGSFNDFDPCWLSGPSSRGGRIAFISERRGGFGRCHGRPVPTYTVHSMEADGSDIRAVSYHETNEWQPSVTNQGLLVYSRWDYVDRDSDIAHHPWVTTPDGRDARSIHGNFPPPPGGREKRPWMEMDVRAIPNSTKFVATAAPHHGQSYGSLIVLDPDVEDDDAMSQLKRLTPEHRFPESEGARGAQQWGTAWPLNEDDFVCVFQPAQAAGPKPAPGEPPAAKVKAPSQYGVYALDSCGNRELLYRDEQIGCRDPIPFAPRPRPLALPDSTVHAQRPASAAAGARADANSPGVVSVTDVYDGMFPWPKGTKIAALRIVQLFPKATIPAGNPAVGVAAQSLCRGVLGTVPVEADGSAHFELPPGKPVYFQALDEHGQAVQSMRSLTYVQAGQRLACQGCHERRYRAPQAPCRTSMALRREPSKIAPDVDGSWPLLYPRLVQPVLDRKCVPCHIKQQAKGAPDLTGQSGGRGGWSKSYTFLAARYGFGFQGGNGAIRSATRGGSRTVPGEFGAAASGIIELVQGRQHVPYLLRGDRNAEPVRHGKVDLTAEELHRLILWVDCNSVFYGAYFETQAQGRGEIVRPSIE